MGKIEKAKGRIKSGAAQSNIDNQYSIAELTVRLALAQNSSIVFTVDFATLY